MFPTELMFPEELYSTGFDVSIAIVTPLHPRAGLLCEELQATNFALVFVEHML